MKTVIYVCPVECQCSDVNGTLLIDCSNRNLTQIPNEIPKNVHKLNLSDNLLSHIDVNAFSELTEVREILLTNNQIDFLDNEVRFFRFR
jgi:Leucine-rich repeat (LRR) protein